MLEIFFKNRAQFTWSTKERSVLNYFPTWILLLQNQIIVAVQRIRKVNNVQF